MEGPDMAGSTARALVFDKAPIPVESAPTHDAVADSPVAAMHRKIESAALRGFFDKRAAPTHRRRLHLAVAATAGLLTWATVFSWLLLAAR